MLGPLGRAAPSPGRRWRRRPYLSAALVLLAALVVSELIDQVLNSYAPAGARSDATWVAGVTPIAVQSGTLSAPLAELRNGANGSDRAHLAALVATLVNGSSAAAANYRSLDLIAPSGRDEALADAVFSDRLTAARALGVAFALATGPNRDQARSASVLAGAARSMVAADSAYRGLAAALRRQHLALPDGQSWIAGSSAWTASATQRFATTLATNAALGSRTRLSLLAVSLTPLPVHITGLPVPTTTSTTVATTTTLGFATTTSTLVTSSSVAPTISTTLPGVVTTTVPTALASQLPPSGSHSCLPPTAAVSVAVVIANAGDVVTPPVHIAATLVPVHSSASGPGAATTATIPVGASVYASLGPLHLLRKVTSYVLVVTATEPGAPAVSEHISLATSC